MKRIRRFFQPKSKSSEKKEMAGLRKAKNYNWKDTNLALFGSETERQVKKDSAQTEPAWQNAGQEVGLQIWRIVNFQVTDWPREDYGKFFNGDSYIILNTYKEGSSEDLEYDVHFWIGKQSTQDEYGTAAYKTVELDTFLDDKAVQHREVEGHESDLFKSYFKAIEVMKGGAKTGFRHVEADTYKPRLLHFCGSRRTVEIAEVQLTKRALKENDVFILDHGIMFYQWNGRGSNKDERFKAMEYLAIERSRRGDAKYEILEDERTHPQHDFYKILGDDPLEEEDDESDEDSMSLYRLKSLSDALGDYQFDHIKDGELSYSDLDSNDVFVIDAGRAVFVWVGGKATPGEKRNGLPYAHNYLSKSGHPWLPISVVREGKPNSAFKACFS